MNKHIFFVSALMLVFANSCAASNGGGHSVGNSMISDGAAKKAGEEKQSLDQKKLDEKACDCTVKNPPKGCECSKEKVPAKDAPAGAPTPTAAPAKK